jgi:hypothetical protein
MFVPNSHRSSKLNSSRCLESLLASWASPFPLHRFPPAKDLCFAVIREFKSRGLKLDEQRLGPGALSRPLEANYKDEFYRACYTLLGDIYLLSEWSGKEKTGRVDFIVKS